MLDLVQMVQSGLAIFGLYTHERDGLLCDRTMHSIQQWNADIGASVFRMEVRKPSNGARMRQYLLAHGATA